MRTIKTVVGGERYLYYYSGDKLISMTWDDGGKSLNFLYNGESPYSVVYYDGTYSTSYYYITNLQGDVVAIMNAQHAVVARYVYDAWGNILAITDSNGSDISGNAAHIANLNPIRYRGYFYDTETGFYYLQSRYYDPVIGRFINEDLLFSTGTGINGFNMYEYCGNNPVNCVDGTGECPYDGSAADFRRLEQGLPSLKCVCHTFPEVIKPEDYGFEVDDSEYYLVRQQTFMKTFSENQVDELLKRTRTQYVISGAFDFVEDVACGAVKNVALAPISVVFSLDDNPWFNWIETVVSASEHNVPAITYISTVAVYKNSNNNYITFRRITSAMPSAYEEFSLHYKDISNSKMYAFAYPNAIGRGNR